MIDLFQSIMNYALMLFSTNTSTILVLPAAAAQEEETPLLPTQVGRTGQDRTSPTKGPTQAREVKFLSTPIGVTGEVCMDPQA